MDDHLQRLKRLAVTQEGVARYLNALVRAGKIKSNRENESPCPNCKAYITVQDLQTEARILESLRSKSVIRDRGDYATMQFPIYTEEPYSIALGINAVAIGQYSVAIGTNAIATDPGNIVLNDTTIQTCAFCGTLYDPKSWKIVKDLLNEY